jgi:hypothetical protein
MALAPTNKKHKKSKTLKARRHLLISSFIHLCFWGLRRVAAALRFAARYRSAPAGLARCATASHR